MFEVAQGDAESACKAFVARQPMGRVGSAEEMAAAGLYLASDDSAFIAGHALVSEGGLSLLKEMEIDATAATRDIAALDIDLAAITQAGGWKSTRMPLQYVEKINAARSGMARAAKASGRD
jgi:NAD(P)-dependent dehydrogenase (short-subunit alcohol dehydrogenase family)